MQVILTILADIGRFIRARLVFLFVIPAVLLALLVSLAVVLVCVIVDPVKALVVALASDKMGNAALNGNPKQSVSYRAYVARQKGYPWGCVLCKIFGWIDHNHCDNTVSEPDQPAVPPTH